MQRGLIHSNNIGSGNKTTIRIVFIGYGFNDIDIRDAIRNVLVSDHKLHLFAVTPVPTQNAILFLRSASHKIDSSIVRDLISVPFSIFAEELLKDIKKRKA